MMIWFAVIMFTIVIFLLGVLGTWALEHLPIWVTYVFMLFPIYLVTVWFIRMGVLFALKNNGPN